MTLYLVLLIRIFFSQPSTDYKIEIWQDGVQIEPNRKNVYKLEKKEFQLRFAAKIGYSFHLNANDSKLYHKKEFDLSEWDGKTVPESNSNANRDLFLDKDANHFFSYHPDETWSKFDSLIVDEQNETFTGIRTINTFNLYDPVTYDLVKQDVRDSSGKIYITCVMTDNKVITGAMSLKGIKHEEFDRLKLTIKWK
jgi:hypothetical protein